MVPYSQMVTPCGTDGVVVPLAPVAPSTHHHGSMCNCLLPQLMTLKSGSVGTKGLQMKILQYNSWNSMWSEPDKTSITKKKTTYLSYIVLLSVLAIFSCSSLPTAVQSCVCQLLVWIPYYYLCVRILRDTTFVCCVGFELHLDLDVKAKYIFCSYRTYCTSPLASVHSCDPSICFFFLLNVLNVTIGTNIGCIKHWICLII